MITLVDRTGWYDVRFAFNNALLGETSRGDDGYYHFWPEECAGYFSVDVLRGIADKLDELNKDWNEQVQREVGGPT